VRRFVEEAWNRGDLSVVDETHAPAYQYNGPLAPTVTRTRADLKKQITDLRGTFPDLPIAIDDLIAGEGKVVERDTITGTHATKGKPIEIRGVNIFHVEDGQVTEYWGYADNLSLGRQLGDIPPAAPGNR